LGEEGTIIRGYSGFYYVFDGSRTWECKLRGKYRIKNQTFLPGDKVSIKVIDEEKNTAVIENVKTRRNELIRPPVSNVDQAIIIMALKDPEPDLWLLDRLLIITQAKLVDPIICFNKADLITENDSANIVAKYNNIGVPVLLISTTKELGLEKLRKVLAGKISVFAGPSGVGKSSIMNMLAPDLKRKTGLISEKSARGKHTTRHTELLPIGEGAIVADTPGFSQVFLPEMRREELTDYYQDFLPYRTECKFKSCLHHHEPKCGVKDAVKLGLIDLERYERYIILLEEVITKERRY
jgi:ribosome biogenesis GTPase